MKFIDLTNQKFERLTVLSRIPNAQPIRWVCQCDCGNDHEATTECLRTGKTRSCGCLRAELLTYKMAGNNLGNKFTAERNRLRALPDGEASRRDLLASYQRNAQNRGLVWELMDEQFTELTKQFCYYCGTAPQQVWKKGYYYGGYVYNGIDRIDNSKGYTLDNCSPCCERCNRWKHTASVGSLITHAEKIIAQQQRLALGQSAGGHNG